MIYLAIIAALLLLEIFGLVRFSIRSTGGQVVFGVVLQFNDCGCKHLDVLLGHFYARVDFGKCRDQTEEIEP